MTQRLGQRASPSESKARCTSGFSDVGHRHSALISAPAFRPRRNAMRWIHLAVIVLFAAATLVFAVQNFQIVTMSFLGFSARAPLALLVALIYVLGMATGG